MAKHGGVMQRRVRGSRKAAPRNAAQRWVRTVILALLMVGGTVIARYQQSSDVDQIDGPARLVDGDSFFIGQTEVRMQGIDAPEGRQTCLQNGRERRCGEDSKRALQRLIGGGPVNCRVESKDQHGRLLATCFSESGQNLNQAMVASGWAVDFGGYGRDEAVARAEKLGLWDMDFERPRAWRQRNGAGS